MVVLLEENKFGFMCSFCVNPMQHHEGQRYHLPYFQVMAVSDIVIYRTRAERLHSDMYKFFGHASQAYLKHFAGELKNMSVRCGLKGPLSVLGPTVVIFHETQHTILLSDGENL